MLQFHQGIAVVLNEKMEFSGDAVREIEQIEQRLNLKLPGSVKEFFSIAEAAHIFDYYSCEHLVPFNELGKEDQVSQGFLHIADENQGVFRYYVPLDKGDDPPVFIDDDDDAFETDLSKIDWCLASESFSALVYDSITGGYCSVVCVEALNVPLVQKDIDALQQCLTSGIVTRRGSKTLHRFYMEHLCVEVSKDGTITNWIVRSRLATQLRKFLQSLPVYHPLVTKSVPVGDKIYMDETVTVLNEFGSKHPKPKVKLRKWWPFW